MTRKQAKVILIVGGIIFAAVYVACFIYCLLSVDWRNLFLLILCGVLTVTEWNRYVKWLKKKK